MGTPTEIEVVEAISSGLKKVREERGLTQRDVLYDTGILVSRIEARQKSITVYTLVRLCEYYQISMKEFFEKYYTDL